MNLTKKLLENEDYVLTRNKTILKKQGIETVYDILYNFPKKYNDFTPNDINDVNFEDTYVFEGNITSKVTTNFLPSKLTTLVFYLDVDGTKIRCTAFNRAFLKGKLNYGSFVRVKGKFYQNLTNFTVTDILICDEINRNIVPEYHIKDIAETKYLDIVEKTYRKYKRSLDETLPTDLMEEYNLLPIDKTIYNLHFSDDLKNIDKATYRIKFEELLNYELSMKYLHLQRQLNNVAPSIKVDRDKLNSFITKLPFELTEDQKASIDVILDDLAANYPMNRLLQGEVGSGKTIVAAVAILATIMNGYQACLMCPTEILSSQHFDTFINLVKDNGKANIVLLNGSTDNKTREEILEKIKDGTADLIIGTHALFQSDVIYHNLGLVVTDEEHRFGVHQRVLIKNKGLDVNYLKMSATPIPRSLAISAYGDLDISVIKTMPKGRKQVVTKYIDKDHKRDAMDIIMNQLQEGHQIYVVTPLIDESEVIDTTNAIEEFARMEKYFKGICNVGLIHGRLSSQEKEQTMNDFIENKIQILVATSVIEVGVNVPNATTILILGAERFGVATLHQLRGRVMRSSAVPYCFLIPSNPTEQAIERLKMVEKTTDGFLLAEYDLVNRGPGEFFGEKQSGSMNFKYADLQTDKDILELTSSIANNLIESRKLFEDENYSSLKDKAHENYLLKTSILD